MPILLEALVVLHISFVMSIIRIVATHRMQPIESVLSQRGLHEIARIVAASDRGKTVFSATVKELIPRNFHDCAVSSKIGASTLVHSFLQTAGPPVANHAS